MKRYFTLINIVLVTGIIYLCVGGVYKLIDMGMMDKSTDVPERQQLDRSAMDETTPLMSQYEPIVARNLFQTEAESKIEARSVDLEALKQTELNLKLWGTVAGSSGQRAYAVIEDRTSKTQELYSVGDSIQNAEVRMILREKVVLNVNGRDEILQMEQQSGTGVGRPMARVETRPETEESISVPRTRIDDAMENINELMKQARIRPHFQDGKPAGLVVTRIRDNSIFSDMGLQNGDVIVGVDGNPIQSVDDALRLYQGLTESSGVRVQILRKGQEQLIEYQIQ